MKGNISDNRIDRMKSFPITDFFDYQKLCMIICRSDDGHILHADNSFADLIGYSVQILLSKSILEITNNDFLKRIDQIVKGTYEVNGPMQIITEVFTCANGDTITTEIFSTPSMYNGNQAFQLLIKKAKDDRNLHDGLVGMLQSNENIINAMQDGFVVTDRKGTILKVNPVLCEITGYSENELLDMNLMNFEVEGNQFYTDFFNEKINEVGSDHFFTRIKNKDGQLIDIDNHSIKVYAEGSELAACFIKDITDQLKISEKFRLGESLNRALVRHLPHKIFLKDRDSNFITCNENFANDLGISPDQIPGTNDHDYYPKEIADMYRSDDQTVINEGEVKDIVEKYIQQGEERWVHTIKVPFKNDEDEIIGVLGIFEDITERKQVQEALYESEERFRLALENIPDVIVIYDNKLRIQHINAATRKLTGRSASFFIGKREEDLWPKEVYKAYLPTLKKAFKTKKTCYIETCIVLNDKPSDLLITCVPILDRNGNVNEIMGITRDLTEYKFAQKALSESEARYRTLVEGMNETVWVINMNGKLIDVNNRAVELLGYSREELFELGIIGIDISHDQDEMKKIGESIRSDKLHVFETAHVAKNGKIFPVEICLSHITYKGENAVLCIARDIAERKRAEIALIRKNREYLEISEKLSANLDQMKEMNIQLAESKKRAEESDNLKSIFLANMSHEVRTPLNAIMGFSSLLDDPDLSLEKKKKYIDIIINAGDRLTQIINDIVDISKIDSKQLSIVIEKCNICDIIKNSYQVFNESPLMNEKTNVNLLLKLPFEEECVKVETDKFRIQQVLDNVLSNAIKYTEEGVVEFGFKRKRKWIEFYVRDTGRGIDKDKHDLIFQRFRQVEENTYHEGTGLGLSIAKGIIELLGGKIWFESEPNKGSTFYFTIPVNPAI